MALIKCHECGKKISDKAAACIHCGCPLEFGMGASASSTKINTTPTSPEAYQETIEATQKFYQSNWFIFPLLIILFPLGVFLMWKYKKSNIAVRIISSFIFGMNFLFWSLFFIVLLIPCEHIWVDATCTMPKYCEICGETEGNALGHEKWSEATCIEPKHCVSCGETEGNALGHEKWSEATCTEPKHCVICGETDGEALGHVEGEWTLTKEETLSDVGVEEIICTVCGEVLDSRGTERKNPKVEKTTFNFTDDELIDWANDWLNDTYDIDDSGAFDLGSDILGYRVETDDGEDGMLLLKHDGGEEVSAIMVYFDDFVDRTALALFFGTKINSSFDYDDAALVLANNSTYFAADMIATNLTIDDGLEVALLTPELYMYKIISGTGLSPSDCYVSIEQNGEEFAKYDNNIWNYIINEFGDNSCCWFYDDDTEVETDDNHGEIITYRGIILAESTEDDVISAYGKSDMEFAFNKSTDILHRSMKASGASDYKYLEDTAKVLVYDYNNLFQIAFYIDYFGVVDFILYTDGVWYK